MTKLTTYTLSAVISFTTACGNSGGGAPTATALPDIGNLVIDVPAGSSLNDMSMGGPKETMITTDSYVVSVGLAGENREKTMEEVIEASKMYDGSKVTKQDKTADGWHVEYQNKGGMGDNYFLDIRRTINGVQYRCSTTQPEASQRAAAAKACATLRAK